MRERLAGLAIGDDPQLRACADPGPLPAPAASDPVQRVVEQVEAVRGVTLEDPPEIQLVSDAEMTDQVAEVFPRQVSGYHNGEDNLIALRAADPPALSPLERVVLAHEVEHAVAHARAVTRRDLGR